MRPFRTSLITTALVTAFSVMVFAQAQPPGGGGPAGGGGPRGGGPRGGPGGRMVPGGPNGALGLALNSVVQTELKIKDTQKTKLQALAEEASQRQQQVREQMFPQ